MSAYLLGQIFGVTFLMVSISMLINSQALIMVIRKMYSDPTISWLAGFLSFLIGMVLITFSKMGNLLESLLYIIGILSLLKGIMYLLFTEKVTKYSFKVIKNKKRFIKIAGLFILVLAIILIVNSF